MHLPALKRTVTNVKNAFKSEQEKLCLLVFGIFP